ncbi:RNA-binding protein [Rummeliibacillus pycnus]|uniref:YlmH family RNA-binding protein n=1 Tax=Rummeliibacillus pycnus TaxID=101070 RepID=UPI003D282FAE
MEDIFQHFRPEEKTFIEQVIGWKKEVEDRYAPKLTDFLDPRQQLIVHSIVGKNGNVLVSSFGRFSEAERQRLLIFPDYFQPSDEDYDITICELHFPSNFIQLKHPDVLGALLSLGLDRAKFGDIRLDESTAQFAVAKEILDYVRVNLVQIGKAKAHVIELQEGATVLPVESHWMEQMLTTSSMRLDTVLASVYPISRQKAAMLINSGKVKVNFAVREQVAFELHESDLLSIRGYGRFFIKTIEGKTKKDKIRIKIGRIERKS